MKRPEMDVTQGSWSAVMELQNDLRQLALADSRKSDRSHVVL